jgi:hypothetical protein
MLLDYSKGARYPTEIFILAKSRVAEKVLKKCGKQED